VFAYGQTGSGKTFTITGGVDSYEQRGLIPRALSMLFREFSNRSDMTFTTHVSYLEIYNDNGFDLLDPSQENKALEDLPRVTMMEDEDGNCHLRNLTMHRTNSEEDALNFLFIGDTNRAIAETPMNMASSRSHCLFTIFVEGRKVGADTVRRAKLHLVDLAGSERVHKTNASGQTLKEAGHINSSLFFLEMVIVALHEKATKARAHIPYRNSMMTSVLRDSLGGNCKTVMVATVSVEAAQIEETISTCKFAQRVAKIKNSAIVNEDVDPSVMIERLKGQVTNLKDEITYLKGEAGEGDTLSEAEIAELQQTITAYVDNKDPYATLQIGKLTLTKLKDAFAIFKNLVLRARHAAAEAAGTAGAGGEEQGGAGAEEKGAAPGPGGGSEEVRTLRDKLKQRDQEIAILVNMVKQAKAGGGRVPLPGSRQGSASVASSAWSASSAEGKTTVEDADSLSYKSSFSEAKHAGYDGRRTDAHTPVAPGKGREQDASTTQPSRTHRLAVREVKGVKLTSDPAVVGDAERAFDYFRQQNSRSDALESNKTVLKQKYERAKELAEKVNTTRSTINYLKTTIEQIRRERAMEREGLLDSDDGAQANEPGEEEKGHMEAIEREKAIYKASFTELRELKTAIEQIQNMLKKGRAKLQQDFDEWYNACLHDEAKQVVRGGGGGAEALGASSSRLPPTVPRPESESRQKERLDRVRTPSGSLAHAQAAHEQGYAEGAGQQPVTGNKQTDDEIREFYRAKAELEALQRRQQAKDAR